MTNRGYVYFVLFGDNMNPDALTKIISLEPTHIIHKGNPRYHPKGPPAKFSSWEISSEHVESDLLDINELSAKLIAKLKPRIDSIIEAMKAYELSAQLQIVITFRDEESIPTPVISFNANVIHFLSQVGASIDIDTYTS